MIIMVGLPASGKSTLAQGRILADGNTVRVNKDLLRKMLHFGKWTGYNESVTKAMSRCIVKQCLISGINVIVDDTNLNEGTMQSWKDLAREIDAKVEIMDLTDVPVDECITRDLGREESVGAHVIKNMAIRAGIKKFEKDSVVICDLDGTLADTAHRLHFVKSKVDGKKDWNGFFAAMGEDPVREETKKALLKHFAEGKTIIFLSGRPERYGEITRRWLAKNFLNFGYTIIMRKDSDKRPDFETKQDMVNSYFPDKEVIHMVYDDRPQVIVKVWLPLVGKEKVVDVGDNKFFKDERETYGYKTPKVKKQRTRPDVLIN